MDLLAGRQVGRSAACQFQAGLAPIPTFPQRVKGQNRRPGQPKTAPKRRQCLFNRCQPQDQRPLRGAGGVIVMGERRHHSLGWSATAAVGGAAVLLSAERGTGVAGAAGFAGTEVATSATGAAAAAAAAAGASACTAWLSLLSAGAAGRVSLRASSSSCCAAAVASAAARACALCRLRATLRGSMPYMSAKASTAWPCRSWRCWPAATLCR